MTYDPAKSFTPMTIRVHPAAAITTDKLTFQTCECGHTATFEEADYQNYESSAVTYMGLLKPHECSPIERHHLDDAPPGIFRPETTKRKWWHR